MRNIIRIFALALFVNLTLALHAESYWSKTEAWFPSIDSVCNDKVDVFYIVSTEVISAADKDGRKQYRSTLTPDDRKAFTGEMAYVRRHMFGSEFNYITPFYHQFTFEAIMLPDSAYNAVFNDVSKEICDAFDYYMEHLNKGRRFIVAGFSQGAMLTLQLLRHMNDEQYERMVAAYSIGYRLSEADLQHRHINAANGCCDKQKTISFNTVMSNDAIWDLVGEGAATCINPVNWRTDATPASLIFQGDTLTLCVDTVTNMIIAKSQTPDTYRKWMDNVPVFAQAGAKRDNLHHWDLLFYCDCIHRNAILRAYGEQK